MGVMDAITLLKDDHHTVELLFKRFEQAGDRAHVQKRQIVDRIIEELSVHAAIEEQVFYPVARAAVPSTEDIALESLEEHHIVKWLLSELADMDPSHERFDAKVTVLMENVRHHVEEEESEFFPQVRDQLGRNELAELGETLADAKKSAPTRPHPRLPDEGPTNVVPAGTITGVVDRVGDNLSGIAQGTVTAVGDLIARFTGSDRPKVSPTGSFNDSQAGAGRPFGCHGGNRRCPGDCSERQVRYRIDCKGGQGGCQGHRDLGEEVGSVDRDAAKRASTTTGRTARAASKKTAAPPSALRPRPQRRLPAHAEAAGVVGFSRHRATGLRPGTVTSEHDKVRRPRWPHARVTSRSVSGPTTAPSTRSSRRIITQRPSPMRRVTWRGLSSRWTGITSP